MDYNIPDPGNLASVVGHDVSLLMLKQLQIQVSMLVVKSSEIWSRPPSQPLYPWSVWTYTRTWISVH